MSTTHLQPSKLGTKKHWDNVYETELANFAETGDEGEIWFGEESLQKMVDWVIEHVPPTSEPSVLEIGSGNGTLLFGLTDAGYNPRCMAGIDYSADAVRLAQSIAAKRESQCQEITFTPSNFLEDEPPLLQDMVTPESSWDLLLDKGTFDAIALAGRDENGSSPVDTYPGRVDRLLKPGGHFLITSCNFTEDELKYTFVSNKTGLQYHSRIQHPTFTFGGKSGSICSSIAFQKSRTS